ncbi:MAG: DUF58 domain-containing protein, partial [Pseudomonadota bacterium]
MSAHDDLTPDSATREWLRRYSLTSALPLAHPQRGLRRSLRQGDGLEFSQYRAYQPGDDLRRVDWRL